MLGAPCGGKVGGRAPFQGSGEAGVSSDICTYDRINRIYPRSNEKEFRNLHERMRLKSFFYSDWRSTHATSVEAGLD